MRKRVLGLGALVLLAAAFGYWRWTRITPPVTEAEARAYLDRIVAAAQARDFDTMCGLNLSVHQCRRVLDDFHLRGSVPPNAPTVISARYSPKKSRNDLAGMILVVEGTTSCGKPYHSEVFVFRENRHHFKAVNAVYWSNSRVFEDNTTSPGGNPPPTC